MTLQEQFIDMVSPVIINPVDAVEHRQRQQNVSASASSLHEAIWKKQPPPCPIQKKLRLFWGGLYQNKKNWAEQESTKIKVAFIDMVKSDLRCSNSKSYPSKVHCRRRRQEGLWDQIWGQRAKTISYKVGITCEVMLSPQFLFLGTLQIHVNPGQWVPKKKTNHPTLNQAQCLSCGRCGHVLVEDGDVVRDYYFQVTD